MSNQILKTKLEHLQKRLHELGSIAIAFSGGVDSTFLLKVASETELKNILAITVQSLFFPDREYQSTLELAESFNVNHQIISVNVLEIPDIVSNPIDRCYHCKKAIFQKICQIAADRHIQYILDGSNIDDNSDYRPGLKALNELAIISPLKEAKFTKIEIRHISKLMGIPTWDKPAYACLATRIPYGQLITHHNLETIEKAENFLFDMGFRQIRVRCHNEIARIEVMQDDIDKLLSTNLRTEIVEKLTKFGFKYVTLDLAGYRTGSLNVRM